MLVAALFGGALTVALTPLLSLRALTALVLVSAAAAGGLTASIGRAALAPTGPPHRGILAYTFIVGIGVLTCRGSAWTLRIMSELDRSRTATPACRSPRSGCASPATCTTCSAGTCP